jgi:DNA (cytosine-5)-methyltransferase 1
MTHAALFNGIGGFQLAAQWAGWRNILSVEIDDWCNQVTAHHFPECKQYQNIYDFDATEWAGKVDVLTGGFPCQPFSAAGKRKGTADDRHLWPEMLRVIGEIKPRWIIGENVLGLVNWSDGMVFDQVHTDLENQGYEVQSFVLPACSVGAPHRRDRVWIVAKDTMRSRRIHGESKQERSENGEFRDFSTRNTDRICGQKMARIASNTMRSRLPEALENGELDGNRFVQLCERNTWDSFPLESPLCAGDDGLSEGMDKRAFSKWRTNSLKAAGNAIVPQVAYQLMTVINQMEVM